MYVLSDLAIMRDRHVNRMPAVEPQQGVRASSEGAFFKQVKLSIVFKV